MIEMDDVDIKVVVAWNEELPTLREVQQIYDKLKKFIPLEPFTGELLRVEFTDGHDTHTYRLHYSPYYAQRVARALEIITGKNCFVTTR